MKLWIDDKRLPPDKGYIWALSVNEAKQIIESMEKQLERGFNQLNHMIENNEPEDAIEMQRLIVKNYQDSIITLIDIDHDAGDYARDGGDYIKVLDWLEETGRNYPIRIHSMNIVGVQNMRRIIRKNNWKEVF